MANPLGAAGVVGLIVALGYLSRWGRILRAGDERVLNAFVYYFALPAFLLVELAQATYSQDTLRFVVAGGAPLGLLIFLLGVLRPLGLPREKFYLLGVSSVFGSLAFFGLPFVSYAVGGEEALRLSALAVGLLAPFGVGFVLTLLELHQHRDQPALRAVRNTLLRLARNPLIASIVLGVALGLGRVELPAFLAQVLRYLSGAVAPLALFSLGVFLYGRPYKAVPLALGLGLLRGVVLPGLTLGFARVMGLPPLETTILVIMNGTPLAVNMIVLSQRYGFHVEEMASLTLVSSVLSLLTLSLWQLVL